MSTVEHFYGFSTPAWFYKTTGMIGMQLRALRNVGLIIQSMSAKYVQCRCDTVLCHVEASGRVNTRCLPAAQQPMVN